MRLCTNEHPNVYEVAGSNLAELLREVADTVDSTDAPWHNIVISSGSEDPYIITLYAH